MEAEFDQLYYFTERNLLSQSKSKGIDTEKGSRLFTCVNILIVKFKN